MTPMDSSTGEKRLRASTSATTSSVAPSSAEPMATVRCDWPTTGANEAGHHQGDEGDDPGYRDRHRGEQREDDADR